MTQALPSRVRCGDVEVDLKAGELYASGQRVRIQEQPLQLLRILIGRAGKIVTRDEIKNTLWPNDTVVEFDNAINTAIRKLRIAFGDSNEHPKYIETVARRGYRFIAPVEDLSSSAGDSSAHAAATGEPAVLTPAMEPAALSGKTVSHYRVLEVIGGGGMGVVYKGEDLRLDRAVALKFLPEEMGSDKRAVERFEREARAASTLDHPNICSIYEFGEHQDQPFIVMPLLQGQTLRDHLSMLSAGGIRLGMDEFFEIAIQICNGLKAAHAKGIIHRDIKPANIFITSSGQVKILDFGLAKLLPTGNETGGGGWQVEPGGAGAAPQPARAVEVDKTLTLRSSTAGTAGYMSPEQVRGEELDARTDIFSFGLVLYEMATGKRAFTGHSRAAIQAAILSVAPAPVLEQNPNLPPGLNDVISKALQKDRSLRYQSAAELGGELERVRSSAQVQSAARNRSLLWLAGALAALLALGLVAWLGWSRTVPPPELREQQLTANPIDDPVTGGAISPDGKYVAYHDQTGLYLRYLDSGETHLIGLPAELSARIDSVCWIPKAGKLLADVRSSDGFDIWIITALSKEEPRLLYRHGKQPAVAPDGQSIAFLGYEPGSAQRAVWVGGVSGEPPRKVFDGAETEAVFAPTWSPDGQWIAYAKHWKTSGDSWSSAIEAVPVGGGVPKTLLAESSLPQTSTLVLGPVDGAVFAQKWSPDGRLIFSVTQGVDSSHARPRYSLWKVAADPHTAEVTGQPAPLTRWTDFGFANLTVTEDGKILSFLKDRSWSDIYLGELSPDEATMTEPHRFTLDDRGSEQGVWMHDSRAILFDSKRNGKREIFRQALDENVAAVVVSGPRDVYGVDISPDDKWLIYWEAGAPGGGAGSTAVANPRVDARAHRRLMHRAVAGGSPEPLFQTPQAVSPVGAFYCASSPNAVVPCVFGVQEGKELAFYSLDPVRGQGARLGAIRVSNLLSDLSWSVSSDGSRVVLVDKDSYSGKIEVLNLLDGTRSQVPLDAGAGRLECVATTADGKSFLVTTLVGGSSRLALVSPSGKVQFLLSSGGLRQFASSPMPSPDGKYLAFQAQTRDSNLWMIDNF